MSTGIVLSQHTNSAGVVTKIARSAAGRSWAVDGIHDQVNRRMAASCSVLQGSYADGSAAVALA